MARNTVGSGSVRALPRARGERRPYIIRTAARVASRARVFRTLFGGNYREYFLLGENGKRVDTFRSAFDERRDVHRRSQDVHHAVPSLLHPARWREYRPRHHAV